MWCFHKAKLVLYLPCKCTNNLTYGLLRSVSIFDLSVIIYQTRFPYFSIVSTSVVRQKIDLRQVTRIGEFLKSILNLRMLTNKFRYNTGEVEDRL